MFPSVKPAVDTATRIAAGDDGTNYDNVAIALHWLTALLVVANFALAQTWDWFAKPISRAKIIRQDPKGLLPVTRKTSFKADSILRSAVKMLKDSTHSQY